MLKRQVLFYLKYYLYWLLIFFVGRLIFMFLYKNDLVAYSFSQMIQSLTAGFRLDLSAASFIILVPLAFLLIHQLWDYKFRERVFKSIIIIWTCFVNILYFSILGGESGLYAEWKTKLNFRAIHHLIDPHEVLQTASFYDTIGFLAYIFLGILIFWLYKKYVYSSPFISAKSTITSKLVGFLTTLLLVTASVLMMRGGWQQIPINTSDAYFTNEEILNDIAVNPLWNIGQSIEQNRRSMKGNPYTFMTSKAAHNIVKKLYDYPDTSNVEFLKTIRPNIVFVLLEGWSADLIEKYPMLTPHFNALINKGYYFDNFYANGWTSDQGMCAILSAAPVFPHTSVVNQTDKSRNIPSIIQSLSKEGYQSLFYFGGQLSYGNIKGYLLNQNIDVLKEEIDFPNATHRGKLGIHDDFMFQKYLEGINHLKEPFVSAFFTMSTHAPYDIEKPVHLDFGGKYKGYLASAMFSDSCIGDFMMKAQKMPWYDNTLFIFVADHGHNTPVPKYKDKFYTRNHIPLLLYGNVLKDTLHGQRNSTLGSHLDISKTLLAQMDLPTKRFTWSKNLMDKEVPTFFPYVFHYGLGIKTLKGNYRYSLISKRTYDYSVDSTLSNNQCKAYFQDAYDEFMGL